MYASLAQNMLLNEMLETNVLLLGEGGSHKVIIKNR
jgi:hypothetical protein